MSDRVPAVGAEAARYCILLRLAPALKHDMVVNLQAVSMMADVLDARLEKGLPSPVELHKSISKINRLSREAVARCLRVTGWIDSAEDEGVALSIGVENCVALLQSGFNFHGFSIRNLVAESDFEVANDALRNLLSGSLLLLTDTASEPCDVVVSAELSVDFAKLTVQRQPRAGKDETFPRDAGYRQLQWADLQALALALIDSEEAWGNRTKLKTPQEFFWSAIYGRR